MKLSKKTTSWTPMAFGWGVRAMPACSLLLSVLNGCGGSTSGTQIDSGLPEDKPANELTVDESDTLCDSFVSAANDRLAEVDLCAILAYVATASIHANGPEGSSEQALRDSCIAARQNCADNPPGAIMIPPCMTTTTPRESCKATVGQIETCSTALMEAQYSFLDVPSDCESITVAAVEAYSAKVQENSDVSQDRPPACEAADAACPDGF